MGEDFTYYNETNGENTKNIELDIHLTRNIDRYGDDKIIACVEEVCKIMNWNTSTDIIRIYGHIMPWYYVNGHLHPEYDPYNEYTDFCDRCPYCISDDNDNTTSCDQDEGHLAQSFIRCYNINIV